MDSTSTYLKGSSHNGIGGLLTAALWPEKIAAVYAMVEPIGLTTNGSGIYEKMWGVEGTGLKTDVLNYKTGLPFSFDELLHLEKVAGINADRSLPVIIDVHGKNDHTVNWNETRVSWFDSLDNNHYGGVWYWDQREHNGAGKNFTSNETLPDFLRYHINKSYPTFSNCSINADPGNGNRNDGAPYGAYNGYLDYNDDIRDEECEYDVSVFLKNFYVGGVMDAAQYDTCTTDIAFRRVQSFKPAPGATVKWKNYSTSTEIIQSGSFVYDNHLMIIPGIRIAKTGNRIKLYLPNCNRTEDGERDDDQTGFIKTSGGYSIIISSPGEENVVLSLFDLAGRNVFSKNINLYSGSNLVDIPWSGNGIYLVKIFGSSVAMSQKLIF